MKTSEQAMSCTCKKWWATCPTHGYAAPRDGDDAAAMLDGLYKAGWGDSLVTTAAFNDGWRAARFYAAPPAEQAPDVVKDALRKCLAFLTSERWGTVPYMDGDVYRDAMDLAGACRAALQEGGSE